MPAPSSDRSLPVGAFGWGSRALFGCGLQDALRLASHVNLTFYLSVGQPSKTNIALYSQMLLY